MYTAIHEWHIDGEIGVEPKPGHPVISLLSEESSYRKGLSKANNRINKQNGAQNTFIHPYIVHKKDPKHCAHFYISVLPSQLTVITFTH